MASSSSPPAYTEGLSQPPHGGSSHHCTNGAPLPSTAPATQPGGSGHMQPRPTQRTEPHGEGPSNRRGRLPSQQGSQGTSTAEKWDDDHLDLVLDLWEETYFEHNRAPMSPKHWQDILSKLEAGFPGHVSRTWKAFRDKIAKMKTIYRSQKTLASQSSAPPSVWKYYERFDYILSGTATASGIPGAMDQGIPKAHVEVVDLEDVPISPRRQACLQPGVQGEPNKQFRKAQKRKREDTESVAASIREVATVMQTSEKSKMEMTERISLRILEAEEKSRKTAMEGQFALAALFLKAIKEQRRRRGFSHSTDSGDISSGVPDMPTPPMSSSGNLHGSRADSPEPEILSHTPGSASRTPTRRASSLHAAFCSGGADPPTFPASTGSAEKTTPDVPLPTPQSGTFPPVLHPDTAPDHATSTPPPLIEGTCWWWSKNCAKFPDDIMNSSPLVEVFSTLPGGQQGSGRKLMHSTQLIAGVYGDTSMYNALRSSRADGFGALGRQSAAALLNAYSRPVKYAFTPIQVRSKFRNGVVSEDAAFKIASEFEAAINALAEEPGTGTAACRVQQRRPVLQAASLPPIVESEGHGFHPTVLSVGASQGGNSSHQEDVRLERQESVSTGVVTGPPRQPTNALVSPNVCSDNVPDAPGKTYQICTAAAIELLDRIQFTAADFWHGYKLYCYGHYSHCPTSKALFLTSKMGAILLHSGRENLTAWSVKFLQTIPDVVAMLEEYVRIRHSTDCRNLQALMEEFDSEEELSTTQNGALLLQLIKDKKSALKGRTGTRVTSMCRQ